MENKVLEKIKSGQIKMKPKAYFALRTALFFLGIFILFLCIIYLISFIIFSLRISGALFLPGAGFVGMKILVSSLPWLLILLSGILIIILEVFAEHLAFIYKKPVIYSLLAIIVVVIFLGALVEKTALHEKFFYGAQENRLPLIGPLYRNVGGPKASNVHNGIVFELTEDGFVMENPRGQMLYIIADPDMKNDIVVGQAVVVMGEISEGTVQAVKVLKVEEDLNFFPSHRKRMMVPMSPK